MAVVFRSSKEDFPSLDPIVIPALDPRIKQIFVSDEVVPVGDDREGPATNWLIENLASLD